MAVVHAVVIYAAVAPGVVVGVGAGADDVSSAGSGNASALIGSRIAEE